MEAITARYDVTKFTFIAIIELSTIGTGLLIVSIEALVFLCQSHKHKRIQSK